MKWRKMLFVLVALLLLVQQIVIAAPYGGKDTSTTMKATFFSESLEKNMNVNVYLPPGYDKSTQYPVLYALHAYPFDEDHWFEALKLTEKADQLISSGKIEPIIIVSPKFDNSWGINTAKEAGIWNGKPEDPKAWHEGLYESYLTQDLIHYVDTHFSTIPSRKGRYIGGASMGGFAALHIAFRNPQLFSKVGGHAPALFLDNKMWKPLQDEIFPTDEVRKERDPIYLAENQSLAKLEIYIDVGDQDDFQTPAKKLNEVLSQKKTKSYEFHLIEGGHHDDAYWSSQAEQYLLFYGDIDRK